MLQRIRIRNFRSVADITIDLTKFNIFVGRNDTGKSNVLRALNLFFNSQTDFRQDFDFSRDFPVNARVGQGKAPETRIDLTLQIPEGYSFPERARAIEWTRRWRRNERIDEDPQFLLTGNQRAEISGRSKIHTYLDSIDYHYIPALKGKEFFTELMSDIYDVLSEVSEEDLRIASKPLQDQVETILNEVASELEGVLKARSDPKLPTNLRSVFRLIQFEAKGIDLDRRGDGIRVRHVPSLVKFLCDLKSQRSGRYKSLHIWGLEEPENSVDFISAFELRDQLLSITENKQFQILMATHSPIFFSLEEMPEVSTKFFTQNNGQTVFSEPTNDIFDEMGVLRVVYPYIRKSKEEIDVMRVTLDEINNKIETDMVDPSKKIIFVEGDSDANVLNSVNDIVDLIKDAKFVSAIGDSGACANAVADNAIAWHFLQKNRPPQKRVKAVGIVDGDEAGLLAIERFHLRMNGESSYHSKVEKLRPTKDMALAYRKLGFSPNLVLESLFPVWLWEKAKDKEWLEQKSSSQIFKLCNEDMKNKIFEDGVSALERDSSAIIPVLYDVKIEFKKKFSNMFVEYLNSDFSLAEPFRATLLEVRSVLNKGLV
ncbi:ATP-dependent nuclease [Mesorhizobium sp. BR1-1-14]|uniref:ATP-dependent nuclease n=1 Tax=Mesorhizobium sp. BR1-1-14 TaxID=2876655 RepID=UPI001CD0FBBD|nr:AAA family ATPase [Mesorhizobium sp. BR1-1-14]MBZ9958804.1 ATP-binding protein [Mesorhizobium sp. BR1-1-14]